MENDKIILYGALAIGAYAAFNLYKAGQEQKFYVPGQGYVPVSQLPGLGYVNIDGKWYTQAQVNAAAGTVGLPPGTVLDPTMSTWNDIVAILNGLIPLVTTIITTVTDANRSQAIQQILSKYTDSNSPDYIPSFAYPTAASMTSLTNPQLKSLLDTGAINGIFGIHYTCSDAGRDLDAGLSIGGKMLSHCRWGTNP